MDEHETVLVVFLEIKFIVLVCYLWINGVVFMCILGAIRLTYCKIWCFFHTYKQSSILRQTCTLTQKTAAEFQGIFVSPSSENYPQALYSLTIVAETGM